MHHLMIRPSYSGEKEKNYRQNTCSAKHNSVLPFASNQITLHIFDYLIFYIVNCENMLFLTAVEDVAFFKVK